MIDIQKLKQFPLAFKAFDRCLKEQHVLFIHCLCDYVRHEDVVWFLDKQKLFIDIDVSSKLDGSSNVFFTFKVFNNTRLDENELFFEKRMEATEAAIQKAFELLEIKLKTN